MKNVVTEAVLPWQPPSGETRLVLLADDAVYSRKAEVGHHLHGCADYAKQHGVWLVSGLIVHESNLCLALFGPDGVPRCRQPALHLAMTMRGTLRPADEVEVTHTELGNLYLCVDADILHPETVRAAALKGADIVVNIQHLDPVDDTPRRLMVSVWNAAQTNNVYVAGLMCGSCVVACPAPLTRNRDGYLLKRTRAFPARFGMNLERLDEVRANFQVIECMNHQLIQNYTAELGE